MVLLTCLVVVIWFVVRLFLFMRLLLAAAVFVVFCLLRWCDFCVRVCSSLCVVAVVLVLSGVCACFMCCACCGDGVVSFT